MALTRGFETGTQVVGRTQTAQEQRSAEYAAEQARFRERYSTPEAIAHYGQMAVRADAQTLAMSEREAAERARAAEGARIVAEARARPPPGEVERISFFEKIRRDVIGGLALGEGKEVKITPKITPTKEPEKYITRNIFDVITEKTADYRRFVESEAVQTQVAKFFDVHEPLKAKFPDVDEPRVDVGMPGKRFVTGVLQAPAMLPDIIASVALGAEHAIRTRGEVFREMPLAAGVMVGGMKREVTVDPWRFAGEVIALPVVAKAATIPRVPAVVRKPLDIPALGMPRGLTPTQQLKFKAGAEIATELRLAKTGAMRPLEFTEVKALPGKTGEIVETWIREHPKQKPVVAGSAAARAQFETVRRPGDLDLYVKDVTKASEQIYDALSKKIPEGEIRLVSEPRYKSAAIETRDVVTGEWHHAVDIHETVPISSAMEFGLKTQRPVTIEGIKYVASGELIQRKAASILMPGKPGKPGPKVGEIGPKAHRMKDIEDFKAYTKSLIEQQKKVAEEAIFFPGKKIKRVEALEKSLETYAMYGGDLYYPMLETVKTFHKLSLPTKMTLAALQLEPITLDIRYKKPEYDIMKAALDIPVPGKDIYPEKYPEPGKPPAYEPPIPPYPDIYPDIKPPGEYPPEVYPYPKPPDEYPYPYPYPEPKPGPYMIPMPIPPETPPVKPKAKPKLKDEEKKRLMRGMPKKGGYIWDLANPIATLEEMLGGRQVKTMPRLKKPRKQ